MGYGTRPGNGCQIQTFTPDDEEYVKYIPASSIDLVGDIMDRAREFWPDVGLEGYVSIEVENIHTDCLTYDLHEPSDYTLYYVLTLDLNCYR